MGDCVIPNCRKQSISRFSAFCKDHCDKTPCGECHLKPGERCDICGAREPTVSAQEGGAENIDG